MNTHLDLAAFHYDLPAHKIAQFPLAARDAAKLLVYNAGKVQHQQFHELDAFLPEGALLVLNDTKVVPARLYFQRATGAHIEILLLHPFAPEQVALSMLTKEKCAWKCMIGNKKRWKATETLRKICTLPEGEVELTASWEDHAQDIVVFQWNNPQISWAELLTAIGNLPLPPYLQREADAEDTERYQTMYAQHEGAVAAPTAGLHFTENVFQKLAAKNILPEYITLHVSAGTFQPIKTENILEHPMHAEQIVFTQATIERLLQHVGNIIAVGTTSMRALESLYWFGVKVWKNVQEEQINEPEFWIEKLFPYSIPAHEQPTPAQALAAILEMMQQKGIAKIWGETEIFMFPPYQFKMCKGLITNFHMPATTLIMLVASFIGGDWRMVYETALAQDYRFLSYGDSSLLWR